MMRVKIKERFLVQFDVDGAPEGVSTFVRSTAPHECEECGYTIKRGQWVAWFDDGYQSQISFCYTHAFTDESGSARRWFKRERDAWQCVNRYWKDIERGEA